VRPAYVRLAVVIAVVGSVLGLLARLPRHPGAPAPPRAEAAAAAVAIAVSETGSVSPERTFAPKGADVSLTVWNAGSEAREISLTGYEDRWRIRVAPSDSATVAFRADRPGEDLAWLVDGEPRGCFSVVGSHLAEGHR
jgi:hypothetical protein